MLANDNAKKLKDLGFENEISVKQHSDIDLLNKDETNPPHQKGYIEHKYYLNLRYEGTDTAMMVQAADGTSDFLSVFQKHHLREFGFNLTERKILIDNIRVQSIGKADTSEAVIIKSDDEIKQLNPKRELCYTEVYFESNNKVSAFETPVYDLDQLGHGFSVEGPAIILNKTSTIIIEPL